MLVIYTFREEHLNKSGRLCQEDDRSNSDMEYFVLFLVVLNLCLASAREDKRFVNGHEKTLPKDVASMWVETENGMPVVDDPHEKMNRVKENDVDGRFLRVGERLFGSGVRTSNKSSRNDFGDKPQGIEVVSGGGTEARKRHDVTNKRHHVTARSGELRPGNGASAESERSARGDDERSPGDARRRRRATGQGRPKSHVAPLGGGQEVEGVLKKHDRVQVWDQQHDDTGKGAIRSWINNLMRSWGKRVSEESVHRRKRHLKPIG